MLYAYEDMLGTYWHKPALRIIKGRIEDHPRGYQALVEATWIADRLGVEYPIFIQAQFYWFDKWFNRAVRLRELCSVGSKFPAEMRVREYLKLQQVQKLPVRVQCISRTIKVDLNQIDKINQARLEELCRVWKLSEEEVLRRFARPGVGYFDLGWLKHQPIYLRLKAQGML